MHKALSRLPTLSPGRKKKSFLKKESTENKEKKFIINRVEKKLWILSKF